MHPGLATRLLRWYDAHGRHNLPWQKNRSLYRVWVSEIMLQQTQVKTVIPYFQRFMRRFPSLKQLAAASQDEVLQHWAGLGYYSRGRNLHKAAVMVAEHHGGRLPRTLDGLMQLPGIGRSTAAAILSQALDVRETILDGNVKRVLARFHAIDGWPGDKKVEQQLWRLAEQHTPQQRNADYTQAIMDLGATLCRRSKPQCEACPLQTGCSACATDSVANYPGRKPARALPVKQSRFLLLMAEDGSILLEKRPPSGIWGGLWSLPEAGPEDDIKQLCASRWGLRISSQQPLDSFRHSFSHYHLDITPVLLQLDAAATGVSDATDARWLKPGRQRLPALAAPVSKILQQHAGLKTRR